MMEKIHTLKLEIEVNDYENLENVLNDVRNALEEGYEEKHEEYAGDVLGSWTLTAKMRCEDCKGLGEVNTDERDENGNFMSGVGTEKCVCQK